jgi:serine/threonine protein phosphatase PrpC
MNDFEVIPLSVDHKPYLPLEEERIIKAGASVSGGKIDGILSLSRALGDFNFKAQNKILETVITKSTCSESHLHTPQALANYRDLAIASAEHVVSQSPEITIKKRDNGKDLYLIGASDGIWDVVSNEECADIVSSVFKEGESDMGLVTEEIIDICLKKGSRDNMTVLVVKFPLQKIGCGGGVLKRRKRRQEIRLGTM